MRADPRGRPSSPQTGAAFLSRGAHLACDPHCQQASERAIGWTNERHSRGQLACCWYFVAPARRWRVSRRLSKPARQIRARVPAARRSARPSITGRARARVGRSHDRLGPARRRSRSHSLQGGAFRRWQISALSRASLARFALQRRRHSNMPTKVSAWRSFALTHTAE